MSVDTISTFFAASAVLIGSLVVLGAVVGLLARASQGTRRAWETLVVSVGNQALWLAWGMAIVATLGSLYYSEVAHFVPCTYCWYQRIAMYPLTVIIGIGVLTRDRRVARYVAPLAAVGGVIAAYHYLIQQVPGLAAGECSATAPCTAAYVWKFEFVSIPLMALVSFGMILLMLTVDTAHRRRAPSGEASP
jgi:disulfide bond formation protein DsbB